MWILNIVPYVSAIASGVLGILVFLKEKKEYENVLLRRTVGAALLVVAVLSLIQTARDQHEKKLSDRQAEVFRVQVTDLTGQVHKLTGQAEAANTAQKQNTEAFLKQFDSMQDKLNYLQNRLATEADKKTIQQLRSDLQAAKDSFKLPEKAKLVFTLDPFESLATTKTFKFATDKTIDAPPDGTIHLEINVVNTTDVPAEAVEISMNICPGCLFLREPQGGEKPNYFSEYQRLFAIPIIQAKGTGFPIILDLKIPATIGGQRVGGFGTGFSYRCRTCVAPDGWHVVTVYYKGFDVARPDIDINKPTNLPPPLVARPN